MFKIGEFSKMSGLSIHTLYHYESIGILQPNYIDGTTNYRYYEPEQLVTINKVLALKDAGFSLEEIAAVLADKPVHQQLITMLEAKAANLEKMLKLEANRLERLRTNIFLIKNGGVPLMNEVTIKKVEPILVAGARKVLTNADGTSFDSFCESIWEHLHEHLKATGAKASIPCMTLYHGGLYVHTSLPIDMEVMEPINKEVPDSDSVIVYELPRVEDMASVVHQGPFTTIGETFDKMTEWIKKNGYSIAGPVREIYHKGEWLTDDPNEYVTELQAPIQK